MAELDDVVATTLDDVLAVLNANDGGRVWEHECDFYGGVCVACGANNDEVA